MFINGMIHVCVFATLLFQYSNSAAKGDNHLHLLTWTLRFVLTKQSMFLILISSVSLTMPKV